MSGNSRLRRRENLVCTLSSEISFLIFEVFAMAILHIPIDQIYRMLLQKPDTFFQIKFFRLHHSGNDIP